MTTDFEAHAPKQTYVPTYPMDSFWSKAGVSTWIDRVAIVSITDERTPTVIGRWH